MAKYTKFPDNHPERETCIEAIDARLDDEELPALVQVTLVEVYLKIRDPYLAALTANDDADAALDEAMEAAHAASDIFDSKFRPWSGSVRSSRGTSVPRKLSGMLGVLPGDLPQRPLREKVSRTKHMLKRLEHRPSLKGDADLLASLVTAHEALSIAVAAYEAADRAKDKASADLESATKEFDSGYRNVVENFEEALPGEVLPQFSARVRKPKATKVDNTAKKELGEEAPEPKEVVDEEQRSSSSAA